MASIPVHIVPGLGDKAEKYDLVLKGLQIAGFDPQPVSVGWSERPSFEEWVAEVRAALPCRFSLTPTAVVAFSTGAFITHVLGFGGRTVQCSMPNLHDKTVRGAITRLVGLCQGVSIDWGRLDMVPFSDFCIRPSEIFLAGTKDLRPCKELAQDVQESARAGGVRFIPGAGHDINTPEYVEAILQALQEKPPHSLHLPQAFSLEAVSVGA